MYFSKVFFNKKNIRKENHMVSHFSLTLKMVGLGLNGLCFSNLDEIAGIHAVKFGIEGPTMKVMRIVGFGNVK